MARQVGTAGILTYVHYPRRTGAAEPRLRRAARQGAAPPRARPAPLHHARGASRPVRRARLHLAPRERSRRDLGWRARLDELPRAVVSTFTAPPRATRPYRAARALTCDAPFSRWSTFAPACAAVAAIDTQTLRNQVRVRVSGVAASPVRALPPCASARACNPACQSLQPHVPGGGPAGRAAQTTTTKVENDLDHSFSYN